MDALDDRHAADRVLAHAGRVTIIRAERRPCAGQQNAALAQVLLKHLQETHGAAQADADRVGRALVLSLACALKELLALIQHDQRALSWSAQSVIERLYAR